MKLNHSNIVKCYDAFLTTENYIVIAYEQAPCGTLRDLITRNASLSSLEVSDFAY